MKRTLTFIALFCFVVLFAFPADEQWKLTGNAAASPADGAESVLALTSDGTPVVAYKEGGTYGYKISVVKCSGNVWAALGGAYGVSDGPIYFPAIAIDKNDVVYIAFMQTVESVNKVNVMKLNGSSWEYVGNALVQGDVSYVSIACGNDNSIYVGYRDHAQEYKACVKKWNNSASSWDNVGNPAFSEGAAHGLTLKLDAENTPYVAFKDENNGGDYHVSVMKYNGTAWDYVGGRAFSSGRVGHSLSLALSSANVPYVAYINEAMGHKASVVKYNGVAWEEVGTNPVSAGEASYVDIVTGKTGTPYLTYRDHTLAYKAFVRKYDGQDWKYIGTAADEGFSNGASDYNKICVDNHGSVFVSMVQSADGYKVSVWEYKLNTSTAFENSKDVEFDVFVSGNIITLNNASPGVLAVYLLNGTCVYQTSIQEKGVHEIELPKGMYIVQNGTDRIKVVL